MNESVNIIIISFFLRSQRTTRNLPDFHDRSQGHLTEKVVKGEMSRSNVAQRDLAQVRYAQPT